MTMAKLTRDQFIAQMSPNQESFSADGIKNIEKMWELYDKDPNAGDIGFLKSRNRVLRRGNPAEFHEKQLRQLQIQRPPIEQASII